MNSINKVIIILFFIFSSLVAQNITPEDSVLAQITPTPYQSEISHVHFQYTLGFFEWHAIGVGYNIDIRNAVLLKLNTVPYWEGYDVEFGLGYGLKYTYSIPENRLLKNISISVSLLTNGFGKIHGVEGYSFELSTERKKVFHSWIVLQYEFGVMVTKQKENKLAIWPTANLGFNINF